MPYILFEQGTAQLNFLLNAQRQIVIVSALSVALSTYSENFDHPLVKYIPLLLFLYVIAFGIKACVDFDSFIKEAKTDKEIAAANEITQEALIADNLWLVYGLCVLHLLIGQGNDYSVLFPHLGFQISRRLVRKIRYQHRIPSQMKHRYCLWLNRLSQTLGNTPIIYYQAFVA